LKNNILLSGGLSRLGKEILRLYNLKNTNFYVIRSSIKKNFYNRKKKINYLTINFLDKNLEKKLNQIRKIKKIDTYIQLANFNPGRKEIHKFSSRDIHNSYKINYYAHFLILQIVYKKMSKQKKGSIINISSNASKTGGNRIYPYASMKAAYDNIILSLKTDEKYLGNNIKFRTYYLKSINNFKNIAKKIKI
jgi:NADP-dependent 3-hydroxy acid dehydrogenase YdfG